MRKQWVSDLIGESYKKWIKGQMIFIRCHTGGGKSYFLIHTLMMYAIKHDRTIVIYVSRKTLFDKYQKDIISCALQNGIKLEELDKYVHIYTYQSLITLINNGKEPEVADYTCMDEFHYFTSDGDFVAEAEAVYENFVKMLPQTVAIGISATGERAENKFVKDRGLRLRYSYNEKGMTQHGSDTNKMDVWAYPLVYDVYDLKADYSYLDVFYLDKQFDVTDVVQFDCENKWLILVPTIKIGRIFYEQLVEKGISVAFLCSESMEAEKETVQSITSMEKFSQTVLISTQVIDTGINLSDYMLKNVILISDIRESFIQLLGRKRLNDDGERVNLYIPKQTVEHFEYRVASISRKLDKYAEKIFGKISTTEELMSYFKNTGYDPELSSLLYFCNGRMKVSNLMLENLEYQRKEFQTIVKEMYRDEDYFIKLQLSWLGKSKKEFDKSRFVENDLREKAMKAFIRIIENVIEKGESYTVDDGKQLVLERLQEYAIIVDRDLATKTVFSVNSFNEFCEKHNLPYICNNEKGKKGFIMYEFMKKKQDEEQPKE